MSDTSNQIKNLSTFSSNINHIDHLSTIVILDKKCKGVRKYSNTRLSFIQFLDAFLEDHIQVHANGKTRIRPRNELAGTLKHVNAHVWWQRAQRNRHLSIPRSAGENRALFSASLHPLSPSRSSASKWQTSSYAAWDGFGGFYIWWAWSMKRDWWMRSDALQLGNWEFQWLVRDCGSSRTDHFYAPTPRRGVDGSFDEDSEETAALNTVFARVAAACGSRGFTRRDSN